MKYQNMDYLCAITSPTIFVSIIQPDNGDRYVGVTFSRRAALDDLISYLNFIMDQDILLRDASEIEVYEAIRGNLYAEVEIVECEP